MPVTFAHEPEYKDLLANLAIEALKFKNAVLLRTDRSAGHESTIIMYFELLIKLPVSHTNRVPEI